MNGKGIAGMQGANVKYVLNSLSRSVCVYCNSYVHLKEKKREVTKLYGLIDAICTSVVQCAHINMQCTLIVSAKV